jgi:Antitoxin Phd_YefM, type II toxin-antitoxin system
MKNITPTQLRKNLYNLLDEVINTGIPLLINRDGKILQITPIEKTNKLDKLISRPHVIIGNADDIVNITWEGEINLDLP